MTRLAAVMGLERSDRSVRLAPCVDAVHARLVRLTEGRRAGRRAGQKCFQEGELLFAPSSPLPGGNTRK